MEMVDRQRDNGVLMKRLGADKNYHNANMVNELRNPEVKPHVALHSSRNTPGLDRRSTKHKS